MNEIKNPEQKVDKFSENHSPEQMRGAEASKQAMGERLDNGFNKDLVGTNGSIDIKSSQSEATDKNDLSRQKQLEDGFDKKTESSGEPKTSAEQISKAEAPKPEQKIDKPTVEQSPEQLRSTEAKKQQMAENLDNGFKFDSTVQQNHNPDAIRSGHFEKQQENDIKENPEQSKSKFAGENFVKENSYDARVSNDTRELAVKANSDLVPIGGDTSVKREANEPYTSQEIANLKTERERVDAPNRETVMQKVIGVDTGNTEKDLSRYLNPTDRNGNPSDAQAWGFVAKAEDSAPYTRSPQECYDNLRLDYEGTQYKDPNQSVYVLRYTDGTNYDVPYGKEFGGTKEREQPCTGNGYIGSREHIIPEYEVRSENGKGAVITDGSIYRISSDGKETEIARFDEDEKRFKLCS